MIGIYFSGTGNTEYCIKKFVSVYAPGSPIISIEDNSILEAINQHQEIIFAYPIYCKRPIRGCIEISGCCM